MSDTTDLVPTEQAVNLFNAPNAQAVVERASETADALKAVLVDQKLIARISNRDHVNIEGWTLLGSMLGVYPVTEWSRPITDPEGVILGWEARVQAVTKDGSVVGAAEAMCMKTEANWKNRDEYAIRSMAQTRAASKALRMPLGFIVQMAGYSPTPAEELGHQPPDPLTEARTALFERIKGLPEEEKPKLREWFDQHGIPFANGDWTRDHITEVTAHLDGRKPSDDDFWSDDGQVVDAEVARCKQCGSDDAERIEKQANGWLCREEARSQCEQEAQF